jgi:integrase
MPALSPWNLDPTRLLTRRELAAVLADLAPRARRSANVQRNLVVVRLACRCGLRVSEIAALQLDDVVADVPRPHLRLRRGTTKGGRSAACPCGGMLARWPISRRGRCGRRRQRHRSVRLFGATYISHALAGGRTLAEVRADAGHASLLTTSVYLHVAVDDDGEVGTLFQFRSR